MKNTAIVKDRTRVQRTVDLLKISFYIVSILPPLPATMAPSGSVLMSRQTSLQSGLCPLCHKLLTGALMEFSNTQFAANAPTTGYKTLFIE
jgi:hypothetical protein